MKNLLIIDLEATCFQEGDAPSNFFSEIIEIGAVVLDTSTRGAIDEFRALVKPVLFPKLSPFCAGLTTIRQEEVDKGIPIADAVAQLSQLFDRHDAVFSSWGFYDQRQFERVCKRFNLKYPFGKNHISLKHNHGNFYGQKPMGMDYALEFHSIPLVGTHHRAMDDTKNIAKIAVQMIKDGWTHHALS